MKATEQYFPVALNFYSSRSEVNKFVVPRELSRANSSEKYIYIHIYSLRCPCGAWQQRNKASMTSDKRMMGTPVVEHGKQRCRTVNGMRTIERTFYQRFSF